ncbi:MAG: hypothetical protein EZS28_022403 [Streblomastix strix]|uniref:Uncharacterized protein n=1 Tax=Streblomastix strix TaxID=222440 RepID=A0A5J4VI98_9EUKA|nr:MAG: hypothetical protein EZS28_022403 [Streblomastix strix]
MEELALLAENPQNHDRILSNDFEKKLLLWKWKSLHDLNLTIPILKFGSYNNKKKTALFVKQKVEMLTSDQYIEDLINEYSWIIDDKDEIHIKAKKAFALIRNVEGMIEQEGDYEEMDAVQMFTNKVKDEKSDKFTWNNKIIK